VRRILSIEAFREVTLATWDDHVDVPGHHWVEAEARGKKSARVAFEVR